jgi:KAP family P-loop domain
MASELGEKIRFRSLVDDLVGGALRDSIAQTDLPPERFVEEALADEEEIRGQVAAQREAVEELRWRVAREKRRRRRRRILTAFMLALLVAMGAWIGASGISASALIALGLAGLFSLAIELVLDRRDAKASAERSARRPDASVSTSRAPLGDQLSAAERDYETALERAVQGWLAERANLALGEIYSTSLPELDPEGLAEIDDSGCEIPTAAGHELEAAIGRMPGGSIGISGPRGAGKTTLLRRVTVEARRREPERVTTGVVVDAPVDYDAREFVLHLFARLCEATLGPARVDALRNWDRGFGGTPSQVRWRLSRRPVSPRLGPLLIAAGLVLYVAVLDAQGEIHLAALGPLAIAVIGTGILFTFLTSGRREVVRVLLSLWPRRVEEQSLPDEAEQWLRQIWFQRTYASGWSGALKLPIGIEAGSERSTQMAENQLSLPDVVALYKDFVERLTAEGEVRIGIDELDKMDDERARRFLNEIKVIFRISGCFYLVSVSEDAMSYFERRGLPFRDVFDSSFDDVLRVGYLSYRDSHRMLRRRVVGLPIQFVALCHILGGGLARDVIRVARDVCEHDEGATLDDVTAELCTDQLRSKCAAAQVAVRRLKDPLHVALLSRWLAGVDAAAPDIAILRHGCQEFGDEFVAELGPPPSGDSEALSEHREALSIALEVVTFTYFVLALRTFLFGLAEQGPTETAIANSALDRLAQARQAFAVNPGEAWQAVSAVLRDHPLGLDPVDFPSLREPASVV